MEKMVMEELLNPKIKSITFPSRRVNLLFWILLMELGELFLHWLWTTMPKKNLLELFSTLLKENSEKILAIWLLKSPLMELNNSIPEPDAETTKISLLEEVLLQELTMISTSSKLNTWVMVISKPFPPPTPLLTTWISKSSSSTLATNSTNTSKLNLFRSMKVTNSKISLPESPSKFPILNNTSWLSINSLEKPQIELLLEWKEMRMKFPILFQLHLTLDMLTYSDGELHNSKKVTMTSTFSLFPKMTLMLTPFKTAGKLSLCLLLNCLYLPRSTKFLKINPSNCNLDHGIDLEPLVLLSPPNTTNFCSFTTVTMVILPEMNQLPSKLWLMTSS